MNRKETTASLAIVSMALLATIMIATTPQALAIDYGSPDLNYRPSAGFVEDGTDSSGTSDNIDEDSADEEQEEDSTTGATTGEEEGSEDSSNDKEDSSSLGYEAFQDCLAKAGESPTEQEVQDCIDSSYSGQDNGGQGPNESTDGNDKGDTGMNQELSATDLE